MQARNYRSERTNFYAVDVIEPLPKTRDIQLGTCVLSCENKLSRGAEGVLVAHYVATGLVFPKGDWQVPELRPLVVGQHAIGRLDWNRPSIGFERAVFETNWGDLLTQVQTIAMTSRSSGGLSQITYPISEMERAAVSIDGNVLPNREKVQLGRFSMARIHLNNHIDTDPDIWQHRLVNGEGLGFTEVELYIGELYSLARSFGVKEILPRIVELMGNEVRDFTQSTEEKDVLTKLASLVVKLKRKGIMSK